MPLLWYSFLLPPRRRLFPVKSWASGVVVQVGAQQVLAGGVVAVLERLQAHGDVLAACVCGTAALGKPFDGGGPEDVALTPPAPFYLIMEVFITGDGHVRRELLIAFELFKTVGLSHFGIARTVEELKQELLLHIVRIFDEKLHLVDALFKEPRGNGIDEGDRHFVSIFDLQMIKNSACEAGRSPNAKGVLN